MRRKIAIFDVLGVSPEDDLPTIRDAWRRKVKELHPDIADDKDASEQMLARINAAFGDLQTHTPFPDRRRGNRRKARRSGRPWSHRERVETLTKRAWRKKSRSAAEDARRRAKAAAIFRKRAEAARPRAEAEEAQRRAKADAAARKAAADAKRNAEADAAERKQAAEARRARPKRTLSKQEEAAHQASLKGYAAAHRAIAATALRDLQGSLI
ncbi:MAG: J domain-containing protein [Pseudomonadota bacterium]